MVADIEDIRRALDMDDGCSSILGFTRNMQYDDAAMLKLVGAYNAKYSNPKDEFSPEMITLGDQNGMRQYIMVASSFGSIIVMVFVLAMFIVLWNSGLMNGIRRYGEIGVRLAMGEPKGIVYKRLILESVCIGVIGSVIGTVLGLTLSYYLQEVGFDLGNKMQNSAMIISNVIRAHVTSTSFAIGFFPGIIAPVLGTMVAGVGVYRRKTSQLFKELEA
jgi:putative ABC transport system permease protein